MRKRDHSHADFVASDDEGHLAAPGVDEAGPAGVQGDVLAVARAEADGRAVEGLPHVLQDCSTRTTWRGGERERDREKSKTSTPRMFRFWLHPREGGGSIPFNTAISVHKDKFKSLPGMVTF